MWLHLMKLLAIPIVLAALACALAPAAAGQTPSGFPPTPPAAIQTTKALPQAQSAPSGPSTAAKAEANADLPSDNDQTEYIYRRRVDEVNVVFTVTDKRGQFITDLKQGDFQVLDDNKAAKQIVSFSHETNLPLRVGLLIDVSNSIRDRFKFE